MRPVLVVLKSKTCHHCRALDASWPSYENRIQQAGLNVDVHHIEIPSAGTAIDTKHPSGLSVLRGWVPNLALITRQEWDEAEASVARGTNNYVFKNPQVFNGKIVNGKLTYEQKYPRLNEDNVVDWIKEIVARPEFSTRARAAPIAPLLPGNLPVPPPQPTISPFQAAINPPPLPFGSKVPGTNLCSLRLQPR